MPDSKVSGLAAVAAFATTQEFPVNDSGTSRKITGAQLQTGLQAQIFTSTPGNIGNTTSLVGVMGGLALPITPQSTGRVLVIISGDMGNSTASDFIEVQIRQGTGTAPVNGAALTGTAFGSANRFTGNANTAGIDTPFSLQWVITGLALGTPIWVDISQKAITGGTASLFNLSAILIEL